MGKETALPKNIRQIGEIRGEEKICLEDYVMTYIRKKEEQEKEGYLGLFLGETSRAEDGVYVFIRGILEMPASKEGEELQEDLKKQYQKYFPDWDVQGCCVIGQYQTERMKAVSELIPESGRLIYHLQEQEENLYWTEGGRYRKMKGYFIFYEQNRRMQEYLADVFRENSVEKESLPDRAIKSFREKVKEKSEGKSRSSMLKMASSFFVVTVLVIGAIMVNRVDTIRTIRGLRGTDEQTAENEALGQITMSGAPAAGGALSGTSDSAAASGNQLSDSGQEAIPSSAAVTQWDAADLTASILGEGEPTVGGGENGAGASVNGENGSAASAGGVVETAAVAGGGSGSLSSADGEAVAGGGSGSLSSADGGETGALASVDGGAAAGEENGFSSSGAGEDGTASVAANSASAVSDEAALTGTSGSGGAFGDVGAEKEAAVIDNGAVSGNTDTPSAQIAGNTGDTAQLTASGDPGAPSAQTAGNTGDATQLTASGDPGTSTAQSAGNTGDATQTASAPGDSDSPAAQSAAAASDPAQLSSTGDAGSTQLSAVDAGAQGTAESAGSQSGGGASDSSAEPASAPVRQTRASYTIQVGDTLADICNKYYGSLDKLTEICQANDITDANLIMPGQKIVLP